jgi:hypothetical protein
VPLFSPGYSKEQWQSTVIFIVSSNCLQNIYFQHYQFATPGRPASHFQTLTVKGEAADIFRALSVKELPGYIPDSARDEEDGLSESGRPQLFPQLWPRPRILSIFPDSVSVLWKIVDFFQIR